MSMQDDDTQLEAEHQNLSPEVQALLRQGRKAQRDLEAANAAKAQMERQVAIERAGIPDHPARELVFQSYDGPLDAEALKAHAEKFGITSTPQSSGVTPQEVETQRQIISASGGAPASSNDIDAAVAMRNAKSPEEVLDIVRSVAGQPGFRNREGLIGVLPEY